MATRFQRCSSARQTAAPYSKLCFTCKATAQGIGEPAPCRTITSPYRSVTESLDSVIPAPHIPGHSCIAFARYMNSFKHGVEVHKSKDELDDELDKYWESAGIRKNRRIVIKQEEMCVDELSDPYDIADAMHSINLTCNHHNDHQEQHNHNHNHNHHHHNHNEKESNEQPNFFKKFVKHIKSRLSLPDKDTLDQDIDNYFDSRGKASTVQSLDDDLEAYKRSDPRNLNSNNNNKGQQQISMAPNDSGSQEEVEDDEFDI